MTALRVLASRVRALLARRRRGDADLDDEIQTHLDLLTDAHVARGLSLREARAAARREFGGVEQLKEAYRDQRGVPLVDALVQDARFAVRTSFRHGSFTAVALLTLALGIGVNTTLFSIVNAVLLRPLPYPESDRLVQINTTTQGSGPASYPDFEDWAGESTAFERLAAFTNRSVAVASDGLAERVSALQVTAGFFEVLKVSPALGRTFHPEDLDAGGKVAILSDGAWKRHFGGDDHVVGQLLRIEVWPTTDEETFTVIGVMPAGFRFSVSAPEQIYTPLMRDPRRDASFLRAVGRLRPDVSVAAAQAQMDAIASRLAERYPASHRDQGVRVAALVQAQVGDTRTGLLIFLGVVAIVLLIACANVANLMLTRNMSRRHELAIRNALGAGRGRLIRQLLTESVVLALIAGALGALLASWTGPLLAAGLAQHLEAPRIESARIDFRVLAFTVAVSLGTALLFGSVHAFAAASPNPGESLRDGSRTTTIGTRGRRTRQLLIITEMALALMLLAGAGTLLKSLFALRTTAPGFATANRATASFWLPNKTVANDAERQRFIEGLLSGAGRLPGVESAALVADLPLSGAWDSFGFGIPGRTRPEGEGFAANFNIASAGYFRTMAIPLRAGREFTSEDSAGTPRVVVINETAARQFWPGENALGRQITLGDKAFGGTLTVIGIAGDVRQMGLGEPPRPEIFLAYTQPIPPWPWLVLVVRTAANSGDLAEPIRRLSQALDRSVPVQDIRTLDEVLSGSLAEPRVYTILLGVFAALALVLATVGLYGVVAYTVTERTHEMGVRIALGATQGVIIRLVLHQGLSVVLIGASVGLLGASLMTNVLTRLVPTAVAGDTPMLVAMSAVLVGTACVATYLPARRASRVEPMVALRYE
ncbi:MAG TPA: ABC transporter permease [Vicinamibacterales bacterium]|nr:ABC transporter permease [Vicinamibacterales bacterium]